MQLATKWLMFSYNSYSKFEDNNVFHYLLLGSEKCSHIDAERIIMEDLVFSPYI